MSTPTPVIPAPRGYRRYLWSAFHRRLAHTVLRSLTLGVNNVVWIGSQKKYFWSWFPIGPAFLKALVFSFSSLSIFCLQVGTLDIGLRTSSPPLATLSRNLLSLVALKTFFWYSISAFWFSEAYIWSSPDLSWVTKGSHTTSDRLNERPIFFRAYALMLAQAAAITHLYYGYSSLRIPISKVPSASAPTDVASQNTHPLESRWSQVRQAFGPAILRSARDAAIWIGLGPFLYTLLFRKILWGCHLAFAKLWFKISRADAYPSGYPPLGIPYLTQSYLAGVFLLFTWAISKSLFLIYFTQEPTKMGLPLSASSKDPNGTLLLGLKAKSIVKTFAFWELTIIAQKHKDRRQTIFEDIERPTGPMWPQMLQSGLKVLQDIELRINGPPPKPAVAGQQQHIKTMPRIVPQLPDQSVTPPKPKPTIRQLLVEETIGQVVSDKNPWRPPVDQTTKAVESVFLDYFSPPFKRFITQTLGSLPSSVTSLFITSNSAKINATVLGSPTGNEALIVDVIESITKMLLASLSEDTYGKATPTVSETVRTFTKTLTSIESFVEANKAGTKGCIEEVEIIVERLRAGLRELLAAFQIYLLDVGLGIADLNQAKKAVAGPQTTDIIGQPHQGKTSPDNGDQRDAFSGRQGSQRTAEYIRDQPRQQTNNVRKRPPGSINGRLFPRREMEEVR
ncbi:uncharacterized protein A1O9_07754 [Exophiala aquamarina CBS 119918]|uniref:Nucleoporin NDC1 n=1 Tax=Exophiala aquamarina CBS 119918 TaxID=1182545 RepID=A0A072PA81_9EURO|nr:uncharacterized protein A1O9_07754 [Exophiala aquamarina CBS 119918]KEF56173.1 hypothetical protein A1O9_07754 [Exophiala aquamarina CBS 119918]